MLVLVQLGLFGAPAAACRYQPLTAVQQLERADQVFLGRAGPVEIGAQTATQGFDVLYAIKGELGRRFVRVYPWPSNTCASVYEPGQLAVVFVKDGLITVPSGSLPIEAQLAKLDVLLQGGHTGRRGKPVPVELEAFRMALTKALLTHLHGRPKVAVLFGRFAGQELTVGKTSLPFVERATGRNVVRITRALSVGPVRLVSGAYPLEGYVFDALLLQTGAEQFQLLGHWGREQSARVPPGRAVRAFESDP
ncbi:MAG: hypothetical protein IPG96_04085 [Proteobacteria bacterium]|nr:hypothetical protein [Pseudomonadota bacterium]